MASLQKNKLSRFYGICRISHKFPCNPDEDIADTFRNMSVCFYLCTKNANVRIYFVSIILFCSQCFCRGAKVSAMIISFICISETTADFWLAANPWVLLKRGFCITLLKLTFILQSRQIVHLFNYCGLNVNNICQPNVFWLVSPLNNHNSNRIRDTNSQWSE